MVSYDKPHLTFPQQVERLAEYGIVTVREQALHALSTIGYYRLSGYWYPYRLIDHAASPDQGRPARSSQVVPGTTLRQVVALYDFDRRLKLLVMDAIERIEVAVRVQLAYELGAIDTFAHQNATLFESRFSKERKQRRHSAHEEWLRKLDSLQRRSKEDFVAHFRTKYDDNLPIWVAVEVTDFGMMSILYANTRRPIRDSIAHHFGARDTQGAGNGAALENWLRVLNFTRNTCAHHARLWNRNFADQIRPSALRSIPPLAYLARLPERDQARLFPALAIINYLMAAVAPGADWSTRVIDLLDTFPADETVHLSNMGVPDSWRSLLTDSRVK